LPHSLFLSFAEQQRHTKNRNNVHPPSAPHAFTLLLGEQFWLIYIDCYGPFSSLGAPEKKKKIQAFSFIKLAPASL